MTFYHKRKLKKSIKTAIVDILLASIGGAAIVGMILGASIQRADQLRDMARESAAVEVSE